MQDIEYQPTSSARKISQARSVQGTRIDKQGTPILKGHKMHKLTFIDQVHGKSLHQTHHVENWKHLNFELKQEHRTQCCSLF